jgi:hypothetical protein
MSGQRHEGPHFAAAKSGSQRDVSLNARRWAGLNGRRTGALNSKGTRLRGARSILLTLLMACAAIEAHGHATSTSYLTAESAADNTNVNLTWDVSVADVHWSLGLDRNGDGRITWGEVNARREDVAALAASHLKLHRGGAACTTRLTDLLLTDHAAEPHLSLAFQARCAAAGPLTLTATMFFESDATQRTLIDISTAAGQFTSVLSPTNPEWLEPPSPSAFQTFTRFAGQGLWHVWIGHDHIAFLLLLLLPSVLKTVGSGWHGTRWLGVRNVREASGDLLRVITAFTLAHSVTLTLAATGTVQLPVRPIEIAIALSIVVAGLLNLFPAAARTRLALAFGFGLIHGFGFANALAELGSHGARLIPLAGFNAGVELGQISLVVLVLPFLLRARSSTFYAGRFMPAASLAAAMAGAAWLATRTA